jgi:DNA-binding LacI/PurR family transcriptional regulator
MKITIKDLARMAGVSVTTVSRALNGYRDISPETRKRILQLAEELNFQPSGIARSLVKKKSKTLGLIISELTRSRRGHHFLFDIIYGVNDRASELGYDVILAATTPDRQTEVPYMELCRRRQLDGVILLGARIHDPYLREVLEASVPCALIDIPLVAETCSHITVNNRKGAMFAVRHLFGQGHRRIGMINGHREAFVSEQRLEGYRAALLENGMPYEEEMVFFGDFDLESGRKGIRHLLSRFPDLTAVFCASDWMAIGAIQELKEMGKRVPEDVAVVGYDDIDLAQYVSPSLTTIHQPRYEFGVQAVDALVELFNGKQGKAVVLEPRLIVRQSSIRTRKSV